MLIYVFYIFIKVAENSLHSNVVTERMFLMGENRDLIVDEIVDLVRKCKDLSLLRMIRKILIKG